MVRSEKFIVTIHPDLEEITPEYLQSLTKDLQIMKDALAKRDYEILRVLGHNYKGSGAGYGFDEISLMSKSIEEAAKKRDPETIGSMLVELSSYLDHVEVVYGE